MVWRNPRYEIDIMIIQALEEESHTGYTDLEEKISLRCQSLGLKKPSSATFYHRLTNLCKKDVVDKEEGMYGITYYSLKYHHYTTYVENVLSLHRLRRYVKSIYIKSDYDQSIQTVEEEKLAPPVAVLNQESE
jgi:DNA-binding PadR family transcriptional regulator